MRSLVSTILGNKRAAILWGAVAVTALTLAFVASAQATDKSSFCNTCHEMTPFYDAWADGAHASIACIECHVDAETTKRLAHKVTALGEVWDHFFGDPLFPMATTNVPDERCLACHEGTIDPGIAGFDHETHRAGKPCVTCHSGVGHSVTATALAEAGVLDPVAQTTKEAQTVMAAGRGAANLAGHVAVVCSDCHDMAKTGCVSCHKAGHEPRDASTTCTDCHSPGTAWTFTHPVRTDCAACHTAPAGHYAPECTTCHSPGEKWTFVHPGASTVCTNCHAKPSGHSSSTCASCHKPGVSWAFTHPTSRDCASCHKAPANHYGTSCATCHSATRSWTNATFSHPAVPGGEHTYRSFACNRCHPSGYASVNCTSCHDSQNDD